MNGIMISALNLAVVCVDSYSPAAGRLYTRLSEDPQHFGSIYDIVDQIDNLCDQIGYPHRSQRPRTFNGDGKLPERLQFKGGTTMSYEKLSKKSGDRGTFMVHVQYRQNATWQGQVTWVEKKQTQSFRSALELMKLIDGALDHGADEASADSGESDD